jgi:hypothetical protein
MKKNPYDKAILWLTAPVLAAPLSLLAYIPLMNFEKGPDSSVMNCELVIFWGLMFIAFFTSPISVFLFWKSSQRWLLVPFVVINILNTIVGVFCLVLMLIIVMSGNSSWD